MLSQSFKIHLTLYVLVNLFLVGIWAASGGGYFWPVWPVLGWGMNAARSIPGGKRQARDVEDTMDAD